MTWLWDDRVPRPAAEQMALDAVLQARAARDGATVLRLYRWEQDTVSFGANEAAARHWAQDRLDADGVPCVRRPTGGRAVWHAHDDLTYAWTGPAARLGGQRPAYAALHTALASALAPVLGNLALAPAPPRLPGLARGACFDVPVGGEILLGGRKVVGSAQHVRDGALLQHGAIARSDHTNQLRRYAAEPGASTNAAPTHPALPSADRLAEAITSAWHSHGGEVIPPELTLWAQQVSVEEAPRFRDPAWTWRR